LGTLVNDLLVESFADLFNVAYTAQMEANLDEVEDGKLKWTQALRGFYDKFTIDLKSAQQHMRDVKRQEILTDEVCDKCGSKMAIKFGRFGQFLACTNYPECKNTRELAKPAEANGKTETNGEENPYANETCQNCGRPMTLKKGRFGQFLACTGYPDCKTTRKITKTGAVAAAPVPINEYCPDCGSQLAIRQGPYGEFTACSRYPECKYIKRETTGVACPRPGCKGEIIVKKSKRGKVFYGCSEYPKCDAVYWDKPVSEVCPQCNAPFLLEKYNAKKEETIKHCATEGCDYKSGGATAPLAAKAKKAASKSKRTSKVTATE
jgi:DNA topoisomerase I